MVELAEPTVDRTVVVPPKVVARPEIPQIKLHFENLDLVAPEKPSLTKTARVRRGEPTSPQFGETEWEIMRRGFNPRVPAPVVIPPNLTLFEPSQIETKKTNGVTEENLIFWPDLGHEKPSPNRPSALHSERKIS